MTESNFPVPTMTFPTKNPYSLSGSMQQGSGVEGLATWAMRAIHQQPSKFNTQFFGTQNIEYLQRRIISDVRKLTGFSVGRQSDEALVTIMVGMYIEYSENTGGDTQIARLNNAVLAECVKQVINGIRAYSGYVRDASTNAKPIARPENPSVKGARILPGFLPLVK
jgi:hypothetical protein